MQLFLFYFPKYFYYIQTPNACFLLKSFYLFKFKLFVFWPCFNIFFFKTPVANNGKNIQRNTKQVYMVQDFIYSL